MFKVIGTELYFNNDRIGDLFDVDRITPTLRDDAIAALYGIGPEKVRVECPECGERFTVEE